MTNADMEGYMKKLDELTNNSKLSVQIWTMVVIPYSSQIMEEMRHECDDCPRVTYPAP